MFIVADGLDVHVQIEGPKDAPALLLLHSLGTSLHVWDAQAAALAEHFRVIRPDLRGHGLTAVTNGPYSIAGMARDVLAVLDALGIGRAHVGGLSIGGLIAQSLAAQAPERVLSLILCDTALAIPPAANWHERAALVRGRGIGAIAETVMARWVTPGFQATPGAAGLRAMLLRTDPEGYAAAAEAIAAADLTESTARLRLPALVVVGDADLATPPEAARALAAAIGGQLAIVANAAHIPTVEQPEAVSAALRDFLLATGADRYAAGLSVRRRTLGEAHVARATASVTDLDRDFQRYITEAAWGSVWSRPHFSPRERSIVTLALLAALGHEEEFRLHLRATRNTGASPADLTEALLHVAVYAGIPAANAAMRIAKETLKTMEAEP